MSYLHGVFHIGPQVSDSLLDALARVYQCCFAEEPWCEQFSLEEARAIIEDLLSHGQLIISPDGEEIRGFGIGLPLRDYTGREELVELGLDPDAYYIAELATNPAYRNKGVCSAVVNMFQALAGPHHSELTLRTRVDNRALTGLITRYGLREIARYWAKTGGVRSERSVFKFPLSVH